MSLSVRARRGVLGFSALIVGGAALVVACTGEDAVLTDAPPAEAGTDAADASADAELACDPAKDFGEGVPVPGLADPAFVDSEARFSADERVVYFTRFAYVDGGSPGLTFDIYTSSRASRALAFDPPQRMPAPLNVGDLDTSPTVTGDGNDLFFERLNRIWHRSGMLAPDTLYGEITREPVLSPYVLPDGSAIYFVRSSSTADGGSSSRIHRAGRGNGSYSVITTIPGLPQAPSQGAPVVSPDELTIYWSTNVGNSFDVFVASRPDTASPFSDVHPLSSINTTARHEGPTFISADGCRLYYASGVGTYPSRDLQGDIFVATKPR